MVFVTKVSPSAQAKALVVVTALRDMDAQEQEQDSGPLTVVLGCWTVVLEQVPPEGGGGHPTLKVDVRLGKGLGQASPAQVCYPIFCPCVVVIVLPTNT